MSRDDREYNAHDLIEKVGCTYRYHEVMARPTHDMRVDEVTTVQRLLTKADRWLRRKTTWDDMLDELALILLSPRVDLYRDLPPTLLPMEAAADVLTTIMTAHVTLRWPGLNDLCVRPIVFLTVYEPASYAAARREVIVERAMRN